MSGNDEPWPIARFETELRGSAQSRGCIAVANPLAEALKIIELNPAFAQSRLLARVMSALATACGSFRRAEVSAFDSRTLAIVLSLLDAAKTGVPAREEWTRAVALATAAQRAAGAPPD